MGRQQCRIRIDLRVNRYTMTGRELDLLSEIKLSRHYDIGLQYGHLFPGDFVKTYTPGAGHSFYAVYFDLRLQ